MVRMGEDSRKDNNNMKSIAIVGLVYLPGTFVSSLFGMNFFNFNAEQGYWTVSDKFWLYWAITAPLTLVTIFVWVMAFMDNPAGRRMRKRWRRKRELNNMVSDL